MGCVRASGGNIHPPDAVGVTTPRHLRGVRYEDVSGMSGCAKCGFELWNPVAELSVSTVGLYDDGRFPGRLIVSLNDHFDHLDDVDAPLTAAFMDDIRAVSKVLREMDEVTRVNVAILGNKVPHVHAHVIPRCPLDVNYGLSPWDSAAELVRMSDSQFQETYVYLRERLAP